MSTIYDQVMSYMEGKWVALAVALGTYLIGFTTSSRRTVNGVVVEDITLDYGALIAGPVAIVLAAMIALKLSRRPTIWGNRIVHYAILAGIAAIGAYHFLTSGFFI
jgi:hypothetical protein